MCAVVKGALHSEMASGNVGALCYSRWKGRQVVRNIWTGTDPNTSAQQTRRGYVTTFSQRWGQTLTSAQRAMWEELARKKRFSDRFGDLKSISGYLLYLKRNCQRKPGYSGYLDEPTEGGEIAFFGEFELTYYPSTPYIWVRPRYGAADNNHEGYEFWRAGPYTSEARNPTEGEWKYKQDKIPPSSWNDLGITNGKWYWYRFRASWDSGVVGSWWIGQIYSG